MSDFDTNLRGALQLEQRRNDKPIPGFDRVWADATARARPPRIFAAAMAAALVAGVALILLLARDGVVYVDVDELLTSTSWSAPSDSLLPEHRFDIYQEVPRLIESTEPIEGALL